MIIKFINREFQLKILQCCEIDDNNANELVTMIMG